MLQSKHPHTHDSHPTCRLSNRTISSGHARLVRSLSADMDKDAKIEELSEKLEAAEKELAQVKAMLAAVKGASPPPSPS